MNKDIAVIGMSCVFPKSKDIKSYRNNLVDAKDMISTPSTKRILLSGMLEQKEYMEYGYLDDIDQFDYEFFSISPREARLMDPQHRIALQEAVKTIWDAGYSLDSMRKSKTAIVMCCGDSHYKELMKDNDGLTTTGNIKSLVPGRIAYHLDFRGPSYLVDTSCSSSLFAIHQACNHLNNNDVDFVLAGGIFINASVFPADNINKDTLGIASLSGRARTFDESCDGCGGGEGCGFVLLKKYEKAVSDRDNIYAVIKGSAVNHDGATSNNIVAPSPVSQTEVIKEAWNKANINCETIGYIEAHGTGTKIGDPIEIKALTDAFNEYTKKKQFCAISAVKTNIGHTSYSAGIASFIKAVLAVKYAEKYPLVHYKQANKHIDFSKSAVYPCTKYEKWNDFVRCAAVSSFGLNGTNVHVVIQSNTIQHEIREKKALYPIIISARTKKLFNDYCKEIKKWVINNRVPIQDIAYTLFVGRDEYNYKTLFFAESNMELINKLTELKEYKQNIGKNCVFLCSHDAIFSDRECNKDNQKVDYVKRGLCQIDAYKNLKPYISSKTMLVGCGNGNRVVEYLTEKCSLDEMKKLIKPTEEFEFNEANFTDVISNMYEKSVFIELGKNGYLSNKIKKLFPKATIVFFDKEAHLEESLCLLFRNGLSLDLSSYFGEDLRRVAMPFCKLNTKDCWIKSPQNNINNLLDTKIKIDGDDSESTLDFVLGLWRKVLGVENISRTSDFFDIGGNSIMAMQITNRIEEHKKVIIDFDELYSYTTPIELASLIDERLDSITDLDQDYLNEKDKVDDIELSHFQKSMLAIYKQDEDSTAYNMPAEIIVKGNLNKDNFIEAFIAIAKKHEILRTIYKEENGKFIPSVISDIDIMYRDLSYEDEQKQILKYERDKVYNYAFHLEKDVPLRVRVFRTREDMHHVFVLMHHIAADGWSVGIILKELVNNYKQLEKNGFLKKQKIVKYSQYVKRSYELLNSEVGKQKKMFWLNYLSNVPECLDFPIDRLRPEVICNAGDNYSFIFSEQLNIKVQKYARENKVTIYSLLFSNFCLLLYRYSLQNDFCVGTPVANRMGVREESMIGFFANTLAIRTIFNANQSFTDYIKEFHNHILKVLRNQDIPFELVVNLLKVKRNSSYTPLFQYGFALQNLENNLVIEGLEFEYLETKQRDSKFELLLSLHIENGYIIGDIEYMTALFKRSSIENFAKNYMRLLNNVIDSPDCDISQISFDDAIENKLQASHIDNTSLEEYDF